MLRWLVIFTADFASYSDIIIIYHVGVCIAVMMMMMMIVMVIMVVVRIRREHLCRLRLLESSNNFTMSRRTFRIGCSCCNIRRYWIRLFHCGLALRLIALKYGRFVLCQSIWIIATIWISCSGVFNRLVNFRAIRCLGRYCLIAFTSRLSRYWFFFVSIIIVCVLHRC